MRQDRARGRVYAAARGDEALEDITPPKECQRGWRVEEEFISPIRGEEDLAFTDFEIGVRYMEFTEAVAQSSASGQAVPLPLEN